jgi:Aspartyl protease
MRLTSPQHNTLVPFARERSGHITVVAHLAGQAARLVVDTGAGCTCIHSGALDHYKLSLSKRTRKGGGVGTSTMRMTTVASHDLQIAELDLSAFKLIALDLSHVNAGLAKDKVAPIAGVLGADVLHRKHSLIDYRRGFILFSHKP